MGRGTPQIRISPYAHRSLRLHPPRNPHTFPTPLGRKILHRINPTRHQLRSQIRKRIYQIGQKLSPQIHHKKYRRHRQEIMVPTRVPLPRYRLEVSSPLHRNVALTLTILHSIQTTIPGKSPYPQPQLSQHSHTSISYRQTRTHSRYHILQGNSGYWWGPTQRPITTKMALHIHPQQGNPITHSQKKDSFNRHNHKNKYRNHSHSRIHRPVHPNTTPQPISHTPNNSLSSNKNKLHHDTTSKKHTILTITYTRKNQQKTNSTQKQRKDYNTKFIKRDLHTFEHTLKKL